MNPRHISLLNTSNCPEIITAPAAAFVQAAIIPRLDYFRGLFPSLPAPGSLHRGPVVNLLIFIIVSIWLLWVFGVACGILF